MKFRVEHEDLADAVAWVARALPARPVAPVLAGLRLAATAGDGLLLSCFDYELSASMRVDAEVEEPGTAVVPGRLLAEITRSLPGEPVQFASASDEVALACGSAEFTLIALPEAEYPGLPPPPPVAGTVDGGALAAALAQVLPATSRDDTLAILTAVCLDIREATVTLAATDRYRLAVRDLSWEPARPGLRAIALVPARTLADAARVMAAGAPVSVGFGEREDGGAPQRPRAGAGPRPVEGMISFESGGRRLMGRLLAGEFIRYESRFPGEFGCRAELPAASFTEAVRRVSLVAERASPVRLTFTPGRVTIEAQSEGRARAVESVTASFHGGEREISFNPQYLLDGLVAAAVAPAIRLEFTSPAKPALVTPVAGPGAEEAQDGDGGQEAGAAQDGALPGERPPFRYLVVPLRPPARG